MNDLTKDELTEIHRCLKFMTKGGVTPYSTFTIDVMVKIKSIIESYCEHEFYVNGCGENVFGQCFKCGEIKRLGIK